MPAVVTLWLGPILAILLVDLALSGDNALVIGAAASKLGGKERRQAIIFGGLAAAILRITLTAGAVFILRLPFLNVIGGILVLIIAVQLIRDMYQAEEAVEGNQTASRRNIKSHSKLIAACVTIVTADISMSLDNVLAIAALAKNNFVILIIGLALSVLFLLLASSYIARLMERFPILLYGAGAVLAWTAATMILDDKGIKPFIDQVDQQVPGPLFLYLEAVTLLIFALGSYWWWHQHRQHEAEMVPVTKKRN